MRWRRRRRYSQGARTFNWLKGELFSTKAGTDTFMTPSS